MCWPGPIPPVQIWSAIWRVNDPVDRGYWIQSLHHDWIIQLRLMSYCLDRYERVARLRGGGIEIVQLLPVGWTSPSVESMRWLEFCHPVAPSLDAGDWSMEPAIGIAVDCRRYQVFDSTAGCPWMLEQLWSLLLKLITVPVGLWSACFGYLLSSVVYWRLEPAGRWPLGRGFRFRIGSGRRLEAEDRTSVTQGSEMEHLEHRIVDEGRGRKTPGRNWR